MTLFEKLLFDSGISVAGIVSTSFAVVISNGVTSFIAIIDNDNYIISILIRLFEMLNYFKDLIFLIFIDTSNKMIAMKLISFQIIFK